MEDIHNRVKLRSRLRRLVCPSTNCLKTLSAVVILLDLLSLFIFRASPLVTVPEVSG